MSIADNIATVESRIAAACARAGRTREDVTLIAVSKTLPPDAVSEAIAAGIREIGENRVQEARDKRPLVVGSARWHLIGHLQTNKAKDAARLFDVIQTVDSVSLAEKISAAAQTSGRAIEILLEVNIGREPQKHGVAPEEVGNIVDRLRTLAGIHVNGLMAIPPVGEPDQARAHFAELRKMRASVGLEHLSMGMSSDFEEAIEEGSTMIRVGRAIFGSRA